MKKRILSLLLAFSMLIPISGFASANNTKLVALTFDDGPSPKYSPELLDGLAARNAKATFFLVGRSVSYYPKLAARETAEGHQIANHTWSHAWLSKLPAEQIKSEISTGSAEITAATGKRAQFYLRAPYGAVNSAVKMNAGVPIILWSVDPGNGSMSASEEVMEKNLLKTVRDGSIIILHDSSQKNVNVALYAIDQLLAQGYEFVTVEELFRLRGVTPQNGTVYYSVPPSGAEQDFNETKLSGHWAYSSIQSVKKLGIMQGCGSTFLPNAYISRAMAATILWRMAGSPMGGEGMPSPAPSPTLPVSPATSASVCLTASAEPSASVCLSPSVSTPPSISSSPSVSPTASVSTSPSAVPGFSDVPVRAWYSHSVAWAYANGYLLGEGGAFFPNAPMTKEELYTMLARFDRDKLAAAPKVAAPAVYRDDARISAWAGESVALFRNAGFASKNDPLIFRPKDNATRAETAELVAWMLQKLQ